MNRIFVLVIVIVMISSGIIFLDVTDADDNYLGEEYALVDEGWYCSLRTDGTASIVGTGTHIEYEKSSSGECNTKHEIDDIPKNVNYQGKEYRVIELGPSLFVGTHKTTDPSKERYFTSVTIPNTIEVIGDRCFEENTMGSLKVYFEEGSSLKTIGDFAFYNSKNTESDTEIQLPSTVETIGASAFRNFLQLKTITLSGVKTIGDNAFYGCSNLTELDLSSVEYIGQNAFQNCKNIAIDGQINIPNCKKVYPNSFTGCGAFINYPEGVGVSVVENDSGAFQLFDVDGVVTIVSFTPNGGEEYPEMVLIPKQVTSLTSGGLTASKITKIGFEEGSKIVSIEANALTGSVNSKCVKEIDFSNASSLKFIGSGAFWYCALESLDLSMCNNLTIIDSNAFNNCPITDLKLPSSLKSIGQYAFAYTNIKTVDLSGLNNLETISDFAFTYAKGVVPRTNIVLKDLVNLNYIGQSAFSYNKASKSDYTADLSGCKNLTTIGQYAFYRVNVDLSGCSSLESIGKSAYSSCTYDSDTSYVVNASSTSGISKISGRVMTIAPDTYALASIQLSGSIDLINIDSSRFTLSEGMLFNSDMTVLFKVLSGTTSIMIPDTVTSVYADAMVGCDGMEMVTILSDVGVKWIKGSPRMVVESDCIETIETLDKLCMDYSLLFSFDDHDILVSSEIGMNNAFPSVSMVDGNATVSFTYAGGYSKYDIYIDDNGSVLDHSEWTIPMDSDMTLTISAYDRLGSDLVKVTFDLNGGTIGSSVKPVEIEVSRGLSLLDSDFPDVIRDSYSLMGWFLLGEAYDADSPLTSDIELQAVWEYRGGILSFDSPFGVISAKVDGMELVSGQRVSQDSEILFSFSPYEGYSLKSWAVNGVDTGERTLTLSGLGSDTMVSVLTDGYSADSLKYLVLDGGITSDLSDYTLSWAFGGVVDTSMSNWSGHPSTPVIVGDHVYVRVSDKLYKLSIETGIVQSSVQSVNQTDFYHHIGYGNGMIVDYATGIFYDLDLIPQFKVDGKLTYVHYVDGMYVCNVDGKPVAFNDLNEPDTVESKTPVWTSSVPGWFTLYGSTSTPVFVDGSMYFICTDGKNILLKSISLKDGSLTDSIKLDKIYGHYLDDGWLTYYDGKLYLTSYAYGLFGSSEAAYKASVISYVSVDRGEFDDDSLTYMELKNSKSSFGSLTSQLVVFNGRGYVNVTPVGGGTTQEKPSLFVIDMDSMEVIYTQATVSSHGSIVVDASGASPENNWGVSIYVLSYNNAKMAVVKDDVTKVSAGTTSTYFGGIYCSQAVRMGSNGELIWYDDSGYLQCYSGDVSRYIFLQDGSDGLWSESSGSKISNSLDTMDDATITLDANKSVSTVFGKTGEWNSYVLKQSSGQLGVYEWVKVDNFLDQSNDSAHFILVTNGQVPKEGSIYSYLDGSDVKRYSFCNTVGMDDVIGKKLTERADSVRVDFVDESGTVMEKYSYLELKNESVLIEYPVVSRTGYTSKWTDLSGNPAPSGKVVLTSDVKYVLNWVEISYSLKVNSTESDNKTIFNVDVARTSGSNDIDDARLLIVAEYNGGIFVNVFTKVSLKDGKSTESFALSIDGLSKIHLFIVEGIVSGSFDHYADVSIEYQKG